MFQNEYNKTTTKRGKILKEEFESIVNIFKNQITEATGKYISILPVGDGDIIGTRTSNRAGLNYIFGKIGNDKYKIIQLKTNKDGHWQNEFLFYTHKHLSKKEIFDEIEKRYKENGLLKAVAEMNGRDFAKTLVVKELFPEGYLNRFFPELKGIMDSDTETVKIGKINLIAKTALKKEEIQEIEQIIKAGEILLKEVGLEQVLYGNFYIVGNLRGQIVADYSPNTDSIRFSNKAKKSKEAVIVFLHELGHRVIHKDLVDNKKIIEKFYHIDSGIKVDLKSGDIIMDKEGKKFKAEKRDYGRKGLGYIVSKLEEPTVKYKIYDKALPYYTDEKGIPLVETGWFPTLYSRKSYSEWFCEVFGYGLVEKNKMYIDFIKEVKK